MKKLLSQIACACVLTALSPQNIFAQSLEQEYQQQQQREASKKSSCQSLFDSARIYRYDSIIHQDHRYAIEPRTNRVISIWVNDFGNCSMTWEYSYFNRSVPIFVRTAIESGKKKNYYITKKYVYEKNDMGAIEFVLYEKTFSGITRRVEGVLMK